MFKRILTQDIPHYSFFLFGARQVGKTTLLKELQNIVLNIDFLNPQNQLDYTKDPNLLLRQIEATDKKGMVIIDEVQRVPIILDVVQSLMDKYSELQFALSGSSARKLRHGFSNLLGGRAIYRSMYPLTQTELKQHFRLDWIMRYGSLPKIYTCLLENKEELAQELLRSYVTTYLAEEIKAEALVRSLVGFQNFLEVASAQFSEQVNLSAVGRDCGVEYHMVREYYSILEDTLIGFFLRPFLRSVRKRMSHSPKFYFFDNGVTRSLLKTISNPPSALESGKLFEQWVIQEVYRINMYYNKDWNLHFWRTSHGAEIDLLISKGKEVMMGLECKYKKVISASDLRGIKSFKEEYPFVQCIVVAPLDVPQMAHGIKILNCEQFLSILEKL